jgi:hypothetical protein
MKKPVTIDEIEDAALALRDEIGRIAAEELARSAEEGSAAAGEDAPTKLSCSCGRWSHYKGDRSHVLVTMAGVVHFSRRYYYCRLCNSGFCPADRKLGCTGTSFSLCVQQHVVHLASLCNSHALAIETLYDLTGVSVSESQAQRMIAAAGQVVSEHFDARRKTALSGRTISALSPDVLYLEGDGVMTPTVAGYRETKVGVVARADAEGSLKAIQYTSHLGDSETFGECWYASACENGLANAKRTVVIGDGAAWLWNQAEWHFPGAIQILDFWHALEHVWSLARAAYGEGTDAARSWASARRAEMEQSRMGDLLRAIRGVSQQFPALLESVIAELNYFTNNQRRMDYANYLAMGLRIGSGAVESGCKRMVTQRLKGAGMRWRAETAQTITRIRCLVYSGQWLAFKSEWQQRGTA